MIVKMAAGNEPERINVTAARMLNCAASEPQQTMIPLVGNRLIPKLERTTQPGAIHFQSGKNLLLGDSFPQTKHRTLKRPNSSF
jgi:hypothetical protein